jgi:hypothetical protein
MSEDFRQLLVEAYPEATWSTLVRGAREAISMSDKLRLSTPFLSTKVGIDMRGLQRRAALMWRIQLLCRSKDLPFDAEEITNTNGTSHLLRIRSKKIELHIVRTEEEYGFPVEAHIREVNRVSNEPDLFRDGKLLPLHEAMEAIPRLYGWIMWGATFKGELTHFALGMPEKKEDKWLTYVDVLTHVRAAEVAAGASAPAERSSKPDPTLLLKFNQEIARKLEQQESSEQDGASDDTSA